MKSVFLFLLSILLLPGAIQAQTSPFGSAFTNASLAGKYFFRHLQFSTDTSGNLTDIRSALGAMVFDGAGRYVLNGSQTISNLPATTLVVNGAYSVNTPGTVLIGNPQRTSLQVNARLGAEAIIGSTTENGDNTFDLFVAVPAPNSSSAASSFSGTYFVTSLEFPNSVATAVRNAFFTLQPNGGGSFNNFSVTGHTPSLSGGALSTQAISGSTYALVADGTGSVSFNGVSNLLSGVKNIFLSQSGNTFLCGSSTPGSHDLLIGVRAFSGTASASSYSGLYWTGGLRFDVKQPSTGNYVGSQNAIPSLKNAIFTRRLRQVGIAPAFEFTGTTETSVGPDGTGTALLTLFGLGSGGNSLVVAGLNKFDVGGYEIDFGVRMPPLSGSDVYLNPQGILNAASLAPAGNALAPGEFITLFGSGLASATLTANPPYPAQLGGTSVTVNGTPAPVYFASPTQLNVLVPYDLAGSSSASIVVKNNGISSNTVVTGVAKTAPGIYSGDGTGTGIGAILHANYSAVTATNPATQGETVLLYLTGLGEVSPPVIDGEAGSSSATNRVAVIVGGKDAKILYAGLAPGFPGLYQMNVTLPTGVSGTLPIAVQTVDAYHDSVDIPVK